MLADIATGNTSEADIVFLVAAVVAAVAVLGGLSARATAVAVEALLAASVGLTALGLMLL
jgi:hypothetical protein